MQEYVEPSVPMPQPQGEAIPSISDELEALTLANVATTAVRRIGERGVLTMRLAGVAVVIVGLGLTLLGFLHL